MAGPTLHWPPAADVDARLGLVTLTHRVDIDVEPLAVWRYACNAGHWAEWHPATRKVEPLPDRPQELGETIVEHAAVGQETELVRWCVLAAEPGRLWVVAADTPTQLARIVVRLQPLGTAATRFERTLSVRTRSPLTHWLDRWMLPRTLGPRSRDALAALKLRLETAHSPPEVVPPPVPRWRAEGGGRR
jgi:Polyketide cyclase / dehydrase and lipid transport